MFRKSDRIRRPQASARSTVFVPPVRICTLFGTKSTIRRESIGFFCFRQSISRDQNLPKQKNRGGPKNCPPPNTHKQVKIRRRESTNNAMHSFQKLRRQIDDSRFHLSTPTRFSAHEDRLKILFRDARHKTATLVHS